MSPSSNPPNQYYSLFTFHYSLSPESLFSPPNAIFPEKYLLFQKIYLSLHPRMPILESLGSCLNIVGKETSGRL